VVLRAGDLSAALAPHKAIVANPTLPHHALAHLVAVDTATVTLRTCDGRHDLTSTLAAEASGRVDVLCDAAELAEVVARMDAAKPLRVEVAHSELRLVQGRRTVRLARVESVLHGPLCNPSAVPTRGAWYQADAARLAAMLRAVLRSASTDSTRPSLFGVQVAGLGRWAYAGSTDGICVATIRKAILGVPEGAPQAWGLFLPPATAGAWVDLLSRAGDGPADVWVPYADAAGHPYREDRPVHELPTWEALSAAVKAYPWSAGRSPDAVVLRVKGLSLAARTMACEPAGITLGHGEASEPDHSTRVAPEAIAAALRAAVVTCDRDKDIFPRIEAHIAQGTVPALVISSSSRRGSATEDRVEVVEAEGSKVPAAINPKLLLDAVETARVLGDDTDLRLAWQAFRSGSAWATSPSGYSLEDAPWWVTTMGLTR
jgi:hypothetical protein